MKRDLCTNCPKRNTCTTLCRQARLYADQDYVSRREMLMVNPHPVKDRPFPRSLTKKQAILREYMQNRDPVSIAHSVETSLKYVKTVIRKEVRKSPPSL